MQKVKIASLLKINDIHLFVVYLPRYYSYVRQRFHRVYSYLDKCKLRKDIKATSRLGDCSVSGVKEVTGTLITTG